MSSATAPNSVKKTSAAIGVKKPSAAIGVRKLAPISVKKRTTESDRVKTASWPRSVYRSRPVFSDEDIIQRTYEMHLEQKAAKEAARRKAADEAAEKEHHKFIPIDIASILSDSESDDDEQDECANLMMNVLDASDFD